ncbi:hypothetical protein GCM10025867_36480 [Frondihabitans sucicola]|uniref:Major facilitator superfamily (MFS) profile domain-containing protein n=1 Tax=Frondihabitans sucicola TaxID=1268041 RepID=A0ABM8GSH2_9MICO|nr:MFS transporter [Frondihabitans sucicola]BDZ51407.1 hypothetical protein GCM10025867_36480 [Frondihabitans sucicola]
MFLTGPPIVTLVSGLAFSALGTVLAAALLIAGGAALAAQTRTAPPRQTRVRRIDRATRSRLLGRSFLSTVAVAIGLGFFFGAMPVIVTAFATEHGYGPAAGFLLALTSVASLAAGLAYGATEERWRPHSVQLGASILLFIALAVTAVRPSLATLLIGLILAGATIAPINVSSAQIVERTVPRRSLTQGFTWINTASAAGIALGGAVSGIVVQADGVHLALAVGCALVLVAPLGAVSGARVAGTESGGDATRAAS